MDGLWVQVTLYFEALRDFLAIDPARLWEPDMLARLGLQVLLLLGSAYFSGSETALFSLSRLDLQQLRRKRNRHSETLHALLDQPRRLIISLLCGNELVNVAAAANMTGILVSLYGTEHAGWINLFVMVPLLLLFGEVTPKTIAVANPVSVSTRLVATPMSLWVRLATPLVWVVRGVADRLTTLIVGEERAAESILRVDEFRTLVEEVAKEGELNATERALIYNLLEAGETEVVEVMTPRTRTAFLNADMTVPEMVERFRGYRHSRVPVFRVHRDNMVGFIHAEDVMRLVLDQVELGTLTPEDIMHPPVVVPLTKKVDEMFDFFQENNARAAAVLNEFGGVEGFITMKDVLTFIFGQISGEVSGAEHYQERDENVYEVPGDMKLTDFNNLTNFGIEDPRMTTIGGVAFRHLDRLPRVGDQVSVEGLTISIVDMEAHRIARVRVGRGAAAQESAGEHEVDAEDMPSAVTEPPSPTDASATEASERAGESAEGDQAQAAPVAEESESPLESEAHESETAASEAADAPKRATAAKVEG